MDTYYALIQTKLLPEFAQIITNHTFNKTCVQDLPVNISSQNLKPTTVYFIENSKKFLFSTIVIFFKPDGKQ